MDEKEPTFTVTDRRKFTLEGELRDEGPSAEPREEAKPEATEKSVEKAVASSAPDPQRAAAEEATEEMEPYTAQEKAEQNAAYQESTQQIDEMLRQANPGMGGAAAPAFEHIIQSFYVSAMIAMGAATEPGQKPRVDLLGARQSIDMLALLQEKTKGNLTQKEEATLQNVLFELRMMFLEITNAIAEQAHRPPDGNRK
jgi:hypothetical protein